MSTASATVTYTPLESGNEESRWIRLEQVQATLPGPSVGDAAYILDLLYNIEPCEEGLGGGGEEADGENEPSAEDVDEELSILLENNGQCRQGYWLAAVNVYRTHRQPGYELRSETATVERVEPVTESYRQEVDVNGPLIALDRPYAGGLSGIPTGVGWTVRGATVNLDRPVHDHLILRYNTWHEYVTLRVPTKKTDNGEEYEPAAVVAFWDDLSAECTLDPPEPEDEEDEEAKRDLCNRKGPEWTGPTDCWKTVRHYNRCHCDYKEVDEWEEQVAAPCDGAASGSMVGHEDAFGDFVDCGEEDDLHDPQFYADHCCKNPPSGRPLPRCRKTWARYRGGHAIDSGPDHWKNIYGENVRMVAVTPESGVCGEEITEWNVPQRNCCEDVEPLKPSQLNPEEIFPGREYMIVVLDGKENAELIWNAQGGIRFRENGSTVLRTTAQMVWIEVDENTCPEATITVNDGCFPVTMRFRAPESDPPKLSATDLAIAPENTFSLSAGGGVPPYMWQASGGLTLIGWSPTGATAYFRAGKRDEWCLETVTVVDQCGREATCTVRNAETGVWRLVPRNTYDRCSPPGAPFPYNGSATSGTKDGYYIVFTTAHGSKNSCADTAGWGCPPGTNVMSEEVFPDGQTFSEYCENSAGSAYTAEYQDMCCITRWKYGSLTYYHPFVNYAFDLYRWICE